MNSLLLHKKVLIYTLGCKVNSYESDAMMEALTYAGCKKAEVNETADICIINTCSVTNMAERKSRQMIHRLKKNNPSAVIVAAGCYVQAEKDKLSDESNIDIIVGNNRKRDIVRILTEYFSKNSVHDNYIDINKPYCEYENLSISSSTEHTRAYVKIQDGCNNFCTYCIIPYTRGRIRSRKADEVIDEVKRLADNGIKEIVLTGINLSSYNDGTYGLTEIICRASEVEGIERIRLGSLEPRIITDEFLAVISNLNKVCPHFHLSLQSACNETLKRMNRKYTIEEYMDKCALIRRYYDRPAITTDVIVGFPGETDEEFKTTFNNLKELNLYEMHIFKYSPRKGTVAAKMKNQVPDNIKEERSNILIALRDENKRRFEESFNNETLNVLVEEIIEKDGEKYFRGHTERYILVDAETSRFPDIKPEEAINKILAVEYSCC